MNVEEFKKRAVRSLIRDKYFYVPVSEEPASKKILFVITRIAAPQIPYSTWRDDPIYSEGYLYNTTTSGTVLHTTIQGDVEADYANDDAFRCGIVAYTDVHSVYDYDEISCVKIFNGNRYLGYFTYIQMTASDYTYTYVDPENPPRTYRETVRKLRIEPIFGSRHRIIHQNQNAAYINRSGSTLRCNFEPYGITQGSLTTRYLNSSYGVVVQSNAKYAYSPGEAYQHYESYFSGSYRTTTVSSVFSIQADLSTYSRWTIYPPTDNAYDYELFRAGHRMREECQVSLPEIRIFEGNGSLSTSNIPVYYDNQSLPASDVIEELPSGIQPEEVTSSRYYFYYGDGMTKEVCALYQTALKLNDPSLVGGDSIRVTILM